MVEILKMQKTGLTLTEVCQELRKSKRTIARYIKKGLLNPMKELEKEAVITDKNR